MAAATFHLFPLLPKELRVEIWTWGLPRPRNLIPYIRKEGQKLRCESEFINVLISKGSLKHSCDNFLIQSDPVIFDVCVEARAVVWKFYSFRPAFSQWSHTNFIDFENDAIALSTDDLGTMSILEEQLGLEQRWERKARGFAALESEPTPDMARLRSLVVHYTYYTGHVDQYVDSVMELLLETKGLRELNIVGLRRFRQSYAWLSAEVKTSLRSRLEAAEGLEGRSFGQLKVNIEEVEDPF